jgi:ketosteroid isomerase-like protein
MTTSTAPTTTSDVVATAMRALRDLDGDALAAVLHADFVRTAIDQATPPSAPGVHAGIDTNLAVLADLRARGISIATEEPIVDGDRAAVQSRCTFPDGRVVVGIAILEVRDGRIARWTEVEAW